jgi:hypothetical protein
MALTWQNIGQIESDTTGMENALKALSAGSKSLEGAAQTFADRNAADKTKRTDEAIYQNVTGAKTLEELASAQARLDAPGGMASLGNVDTGKIRGALLGREGEIRKNIQDQQAFDLNQLLQVNAPRMALDAQAAADLAAQRGVVTSQQTYDTNQVLAPGARTAAVTKQQDAAQTAADERALRTVTVPATLAAAKETYATNQALAPGAHTAAITGQQDAATVAANERALRVVTAPAALDAAKEAVTDDVTARERNRLTASQNYKAAQAKYNVNDVFAAATVTKPDGTKEIDLDKVQELLAIDRVPDTEIKQLIEDHKILTGQADSEAAIKAEKQREIAVNQAGKLARQSESIKTEANWMRRGEPDKTNALLTKISDTDFFNAREEATRFQSEMVAKNIHPNILYDALLAGFEGEDDFSITLARKYINKVAEAGYGVEDIPYQTIRSGKKETSALDNKDAEIKLLEQALKKAGGYVPTIAPIGFGGH